MMWISPWMTISLLQYWAILSYHCIKLENEFRDLSLLFFTVVWESIIISKWKVEKNHWLEEINGWHASRFCCWAFFLWTFIDKLIDCLEANLPSFAYIANRISTQDLLLVHRIEKVPECVKVTSMYWGLPRARQ